MKKVSVILTAMLLFLVSFAVNAQSQSKDYFVGKWEVSVMGTPNGDSKMAVDLVLKEGKLTGTIHAAGKPEASDITRVEESEKSVTLYFSTGGYDVYLMMEKKDDNNVVGNLMDMFDATGVRIKT